MTDKNAKLELKQDTIVELPILEPTYGFQEIDVRTLGKSQFYTFDPGFLATAACESKITYIDGAAGLLLYRGYNIEDLAVKTEFSEIIHLLVHGELPNTKQNQKVKDLLRDNADVPQQLHDVLKGFPNDAHPMAMLMALVTALDSFYGKDINIHDQETRFKVVMDLIAKIPTLAAMCYHHSKCSQFIAPNPALGYAENFLYMVFGETPKPELATAMDRIFTLHADHEQNASTSTVRLCGSTGTSPFAAIASGVAALWGPAHGGANEACLKMLNEIGSVDRIPEFIAKAKDKSDPFRLMGFGHRVYKNRDPRATAMKESCEQVLKATGNEDVPLLKIATELEKAALADPYFVDRKLFPNVDFYSGITQTALGIPVNMFTVIFSLARTTGWISQWNEMLSDPNQRIGRPRQLYTGSKERSFVELNKR